MTDSDNEDLRLEAKLKQHVHGDLLDKVIEKARPADEQSGDDEIVLTHGDGCVYIYAADRAKLDGARAALEAALAAEEVDADYVVSLWDEALDLWRQIDPASGTDTEQAFTEAEAKADTEVTRTLVASVGRFVQEEFEQTMVDAANKLGLAYKFVEHKHLLTTQVAFTVTGPRHAVSKFERELKATGRSMVRCQEEVGFSL